jgi:hypothetical protein
MENLIKLGFMPVTKIGNIETFLFSNDLYIVTNKIRLNVTKSKDEIIDINIKNLELTFCTKKFKLETIEELLILLNIILVEKQNGKI